MLGEPKQPWQLFFAALRQFSNLVDTGSISALKYLRSGKPGAERAATTYRY